MINGIVAGTAISTVAGQTLTTRFYSQDIYRQQQVFHSAASPAGGGIGGTQIGANVRVVLEVHDVDPANAATLVAASNVLYDGVISGAPAFCTYALVNSPGLNCSIAFTRFMHAPDTEVRSALPGQSYRTRLVGAQSSGAECNIFSGPTLDFFNRYVPALNELVTTRYSRIPSTPRVVPLIEAEEAPFEFRMMAPSNSKLFDRNLSSRISEVLNL